MANILYSNQVNIPSQGAIAVFINKFDGCYYYKTSDVRVVKMNDVGQNGIFNIYENFSIVNVINLTGEDVEILGTNSPSVTLKFCCRPSAIVGGGGGRGKAGPQGTSGGSGPQGFQGADGGGSGSQGPQGLPGAQGVMGTQGNQGNNGTQGNQGAKGNQGNQGNNGTQGNQGAKGNQGSQGIQGTTGTQGNQGSQGRQGNQGVIGSQGTTGTQGTQGRQGNQGNQGNQGVIGSQGTTGTQGTQGSQGRQGSQGFQGNSTASSVAISFNPATFVFTATSPDPSPSFTWTIQSYTDVGGVETNVTFATAPTGPTVTINSPAPSAIVTGLVVIRNSSSIGISTNSYWIRLLGATP